MYNDVYYDIPFNTAEKNIITIKKLYYQMF